MRTLLLIAYHFPPLTTSGMYRSLQFARYLPRFGWRPVVLTVRPDSTGDGGVLDDAPLLGLPPETRVLRAAAADPLRAALRIRNRLAGRGRGSNGDFAAAGGPEECATWRDWVSDFFAVPDRQMGWIGAAAMEALRAENIDVVYSSSPPASAHVAALVAARCRDLPFVADFRDPWISNDFSPARSTPFLDPLDRWLEARVVDGATRIIANTEELRSDFERRYEGDRSKFVTITNGYDPEEDVPEAPVRTGGPVRILHAGSLYGRRDPTPILRALSELIEEGAIGEDDVRLTFIGSAAGEERYKEFLQSHRLSRIVTFEAKVPRDEAIRLLASSDLLLLIQTGTDLQIPRKLYEYIAVGRPILALTSGGATESIVRREGLGWIVGPGEPERVKELLRRAAGRSLPPPPRRSERFDFRRLTERLAALLEEARR
ncbi:MAG: glycosyltransferase [Candidatus Eisenbacteria bacterium]